MSSAFLVSYGALWFLTITLLLSVFLIVRQFGIVYLKTADGVSRGGLKIGTRVPEVEFRTLEGTIVRFGTGVSQLLVFTSPNCAPCRLLKPHLTELASARSDIQLVVVSLDSSVSEAKGFLKDLPPQVASIQLPDQKLYHTAFMGEVTPFAYMIDGRGIITAKGLVNDIGQLQGIVGPA